MNRHQTCDYIIAGAGSAGCALAARLCEDPDITVCLVEAGGNGNSLFVRMPAGNGFIFGNPQLDKSREFDSFAPQLHLLEIKTKIKLLQFSGAGHEAIRWISVNSLWFVCCV
jgi:choline dehydrogenase-like flavoprotein